MKYFIGALIIILLILAGTSAYIVDEREYIVKTRFKEVVAIIKEPGIHFKVPFIEGTTAYTNKLQTVDSPPENIVTGNQKKLIIDNYVKWKIEDPEQFRNKLNNIGRANRRVSKIAHNALKDVLGTKNLNEIISTERENTTKEALKLASSEAKVLGITIIDIRIKKVELPERNVEKAYEKMKAERFKEANYFKSRGEEESLKIKSETDKEVKITLAEAKKQAAFTRASAEGEVAKIYNEAYSIDPEFYSFYKSLQTLKATMKDNTTLVISPKSELYKYLSSQ